MIEIVPLAFGHVAALDLDDAVDGWALDQIGEMEPWYGKAFTALEDGRPIGVSGFACTEDGTGKGWLIGSARLRQHPVFLHRTMKRVLSGILANEAVRRVEITVDATCDRAVTWAQRLGFREVARGDRFVLYALEGNRG
jgi:hypothetical protein